MRKKIKLTESQIKMLQTIENKLPRKRVVKITTEQYNRIFESDGFEGISQPIGLQPSTQNTNNFKKANRSNPSANLKFENETTMTMGIIDYSNGIISLLKELLMNSEGDKECKFCDEVGISKDELIKKMVSIGMIDYGMVGDKKMVKVLKDGFQNKLKELYDSYVEGSSKIEQLGGDFEMEESNDKDSYDAIKQSMINQLKPQHGQAMSQEMLKRKIASIRAKELERRKGRSERPMREEEPVGSEPQGLFDLKIWHNDVAIFEKDGEYYAYFIDSVGKEEYGQYSDRPEIFHGKDEDGLPDIEYGDFDLEGDAIEQYVNNTYKGVDYGEGLEDWYNGDEFVKMDQALVQELQSYIKYMDNPNAQRAWSDFLGQITLGETTTASSSGSFVGAMGAAPIHRGISPEDAMSGSGVKREQSPTKKNPLKETMGLELKYNNIMHPKLGDFVVKDVQNKRDEKDKISYIIKLQDDKGKESQSSLLYIYNKKSGDEELYFNYKFEKLHDAYEIFDDVYDLVFDEIKEKLRPENDDTVEEQGIGNSGQYSTPGFASSKFMGTKGKKGKAKVNKGVTHKNTMYPKGKFVKEDGVTGPKPAQLDKYGNPVKTKPTGPKPAQLKNNDKRSTPKRTGPKPAQLDKYGNPVKTKPTGPKPAQLGEDNTTQTAYPQGEFVKLDDCTKLNNNKVAQNGGCSTGAIDNVVKTNKSKGSVVSKDALYYEVAKKTGRMVEEVKNLIQSKK